VNGGFWIAPVLLAVIVLILWAATWLEHLVLPWVLEAEPQMHEADYKGVTDTDARLETNETDGPLGPNP
jgi:hypothetical protein